jgi:hypothetical protein
MSQAEYRRNSLRVREIYGVDANDHGYNIHHIIQRSDYKRNRRLYDQNSPNGHFNIDQVSNLCPVTLAEHDWINQKINADMPSVRHKKKKHCHRR